MKRSLLVKGRTYWDNLHGRYVSVMSIQGGEVVVALPPFDCDDGSTYAVNAADLRYVSPQDYDLCADLAHAARMGWFNPDVDEDTGTEFIWDTESGHDFRTRKASFRNAVKVLSEGLTTDNFEDMRCPADADRRFRGIVMNMGFEDPGPYIGRF